MDWLFSTSRYAECVPRIGRMVTATTAATALETLEETPRALAQLGGIRCAAQFCTRSGGQWEGNVATRGVAACATSPEQRLLAQSGLAEYHRTLSPTTDNLTNRRMRDPHVRWCERGRLVTAPYSIPRHLPSFQSAASLLH